ncbi:MAG: hypothetical protein JWP45_178 [Mucilaginibacter sp.]|nr:hypothetical protein [Mucilaginibacter sp.]
MSCMVADRKNIHPIHFYSPVFISYWYSTNWYCSAWMGVRRYDGEAET